MGAVLAGCYADPFCFEFNGQTMAVDLSAARPRGEYRSSAWRASFDSSGGAVFDWTTGEAADKWSLRYAVMADGTTQQTESVKISTTSGGRQGDRVCKNTTLYRDEVWTVPNITLTLTEARRDGVVVSDVNATDILGSPGAEYQDARVGHHYINRLAGDDYAGFSLFFIEAAAATLKRNPGDPIDNGVPIANRADGR